MKRGIDIVVSAMLLLLLAPVLVAVCVAVRVALGRPVIFRQVRPGLHGKPFVLYKFRTMIDAKDHGGRLLSDSERLPRFGRLLRSSSLDELPELWNVLTGDMSLVGPRPLLMRYLDFYTPTQARRHEVRPGLTGWAQINGRNTLDWTERFEHDVWYVDNQSFWVDLKILARTLIKVITREGISAPGESTMPPFTGSSRTPVDDPRAEG